MAQCRPKAKIKEDLKKHFNLKIKTDKSCDKATEESLKDSKESILSPRRVTALKRLKTSHSILLDSLRLLSKPEQAESPHVDNSRASTTKHSNMKTKLAKDEADKSLEEDMVSEPKTRARKKASDTTDEDKNKPDEPKTSKEPKKTVTKAKAVVKKGPLGIRKTLRNKKVIVTKDQIKKVIKQGAKRGRKPASKTVPASAGKETVPLISADEIKKEPGEELAPTSNSRSSSPRTAGRRSRLGSDMIMMKSVLGDSPSSLVTGPRTSPYSMRSERSNSPSLTEAKNLRSGKPRKVKNNLLNEVVMKEQKKRRRLMSESKNDSPELNEDAKKQKRGRSCSRDGSEISKCSDVTESDISLSETLSNDAESNQLNKKLDKTKTDLDVDIENNLQNILTTAKVPFLNADSKTENKPEMESPSNLNVKNKKKTSLKRSSSMDSDNNNSSNRLMLETINNTLDIEDKASLLLSNDNETDTLFNARSSILTSMSKTFNSKEVSKNIRKARRGRKTAAAPRAPAKPATSTITNDTLDDKHETLETLSKEIDDLITNLDQSLDDENNMEADATLANAPADPMTKSVSKFYGLSKPLCDNNSIMSLPETPVKDKEAVVTTESTPSKVDDSENMRLHYEEDSTDRTIESNKQEVGFKCSTVASIDKLMDRLKEFEEFDKKRQRQESESKNNDAKQVMVTSDVVLIPKSGADFKPLKDLQSVRSPEKPFEKENVLSCFENNSAISILKRDHARKSIDIELPNSVTLIKRNSISRKESTGSNHSRESTDAISIFEKSLGKDVTLTEIRKSGDKATPNTQIDLHQFATLHPNNQSQNLTGHNLDSKQISITPRVVESKTGDVTKRASKDHSTRKSSEAAVDPEVDKMATIEKIKSPVSSNKSLPILQPMPVAIKSLEVQPMETEPLAPPLENIKPVPEAITTATEVPKMDIDTASSITPTEKEPIIPITPEEMPVNLRSPTPEKIQTKPATSEKIPEKPGMPEKVQEKPATPEKIPEKTETPEKTQEKNARPKKIQEKLVVPEKIQEKPAIPGKTQEKPTTLEKIHEKPAIPEKIKGKPEILEKMQEKPTYLQKIQEKTTSLEKIQEKPTTLEKIQEKPTTLEKIQDPTATSKKTEADPKQKAEEPKEGVKEVAEKDSKISESAETAKPGKSPEKLSKVTRKSVESLPGPSNLLFETPESQKRKENILRTLGLLTHKAANEAKLEKAKEKERLYYGAMNKNKAPKSGDYTGTLKTVIKLNRSTGERERKKYRSSLKITFQKSKNRSGKPSLEQGQAADEDDAYYTIERREAAAISDGVHRKSYSNRLNSHDPEAAPEVAEPTKEPTLNLVIPEKASSFSIHPGRLCMDQCFYCGGKFGLFDTPCHIAQMKSAERQKKVLDNEEKLTIDSCLCDACYRHVDRRANCPSYRKRPPLKHVAVTSGVPAPAQQQTDKPPSPTEEESEEESRAVGAAACHTFGCGAAADRAIRRKWLIKMRASVNKVLKLEGDYPGLHTIPLCAAHYRLLAPLLQCALCRRRLTKHHNVHTLHHGFLELNPLLRARNIPVQFSERPVLCKQCRYYCLVLQRPNRTTEADANNYRRRLLQIHNVDIPPESENETEDPSLQEDGSIAQKKKKSKVKNKQRKSTSPVQPDHIQPRFDRTSESSQGSEKNQDDNQNAHKQTQPLEEDIESLISSNKIMVPGAKNMDQTATQSDGSEPESQMEFDGPALPLDKQTELQYLLQKQNNPAQFMKPGANLTQKQRNILKLQTITSGIQKPGQLHRVHDKNAKRIQKLGQIVGQCDKGEKEQTDFEMLDPTKAQDTQLLKNLNEECTIESIPNKKPADISILKNKWEMSGSSTQVKKNLSELSKKLTIEKAPSKKLSDLKYSNPVKRLETNPSISVRELFPGEEELPLQCNIEFNSVKGVTPEGWEKCNSTVQYDVETKRLWTELQRPYGNQSSFLRHLVLLEKYFRSGDLVLSQNASPHAATYSDSVQSRLRAYDNVVTDAPRRSEPSISLIEFRKQKPTVNGKSLLKTNQNAEQKKPFMPPPGSLPKKRDAKKSKQLPPELIAINTPNAQGRKAIQNVLHNIQQLVKGVSAADPTEVAAAPLAPPKFEAPPVNPPKEKKDAPSKSDAPKKQKTTSKPWRPTLMPITPENLAKIAREPPQTAVDGRTLPSLVQVMSSGKRYHITLQDYNKMCIMRREKLQQLQDGEPKPKRPSTETTELITEIHPNVILGNGGTMTQNIVTDKADKPKDVSDMNQMGNAATILKNVGLKNITIAPIPAKTATVTSHTMPVPIVSSPSLMVTSTPIKLPNLGPSLSITSETVLTPTQHIPIATTSMSVTPIMMPMPKIPKSLTVIPQTIMPSFPQGISTTVTNVMPSPAVIHPAADGPRP